MKRSPDSVVQKLQTIPLGEVCISVITKCELLYGVAVSPRQEKDRAAVDAYLRYIQVLDYPEAAAQHYARIRAELKLAANMIGSSDLFIAAHAISQGLTLVTNNMKHFTRVSGLKLENWAL
jgi:tRNA(fMet)-specific endonuclease VapC